MADTGNTTTTTTTPAWHSTLDADHQAHIASRGWDKMTADQAVAEAVKAHRSAQQMIGVPETQLVRLPKDAQDPTYQSVFDRVVGMATPKTADEYGFDGIKFKGSGEDLQAEDIAFIRSLASELKLTTGQARQVAARFADRAEELLTSEGGAGTAQFQTNIEALRQSWNTEYDQKAFSAQRAGEAVGLPAAVFDFMKTLPTADYLKSMNALVFLGAQMTEASLHRGGRAPEDLSAGMSPEQASAELDRLKGDTEWGLKLTAGDPATKQQFERIMERMHGHLRR